MSKYIPENPFGLSDERSADERFRGHVVATAASGLITLAGIYIGQKTGTEVIAYPVAAVSEVVSIANAYCAASIAQTSSYDAGTRLLKL